MKPLYLIGLGLFALASCLPLSAQNVGINATGAAPNTSAMLDVDAPNKGLLIPRVSLSSTADVTTIASPATSLLVYNTSALSNVTPGFYYWNGSAWTRLAMTLDGWQTLGNAGTNPATNFVGTTDGQSLAFRTNNTENMRLTTAGSLGIGTTAPTDRLQIANGDIRLGEINPIGAGLLPDFGRRLIFSGGPGTAAFNSDNSDPLWLARFNNAQDETELRLNLSDNCNGVDAFVITSGGSGCTANSAFFRFDATGAAFKPGGGAWATLSDRRVKHDIQPYAKGLDLVMAVRPVTYQYNGLGGTADIGTVYTGVIAQELQAVAPEMVQPRGEYLSVDPSAFTYALINAVQQQQAQIEALTKAQAELAAQVEAIRAQLSTSNAH
jgi:hypothetical protein